jgi:O-antigen/teichoic acid export membrane protein
MYFRTDHLESGLRTRALKGVSVTLIAQAFTYGMSTVGTIILARLLTPHDFGLVTMVISISLLLQNFGGNGLIEATVQRAEIDHKQVSTIFWINAVISLMLMFAFMASAPVIAWFYKEPTLVGIAFAIAPSILVSGLSTQHHALLVRNMQFYKTTAYEMAAAMISLTIAVLLAFCGWGYWALVAKWVVSPTVITAGAWIMSGWKPGLPTRGSGVRPMLRYGLHTYANYVMNYFGRNIDKVLLGRFFGTQPLGNYDRAYHLSLMLPNQLVSPLANVAVASFSRLVDDPERYRRNYLSVLSLLAFICMPLSAFLTLIGKDLILLLLGPQWTEAGEIFAVFGLSIGVMIIYSTQSWIHLSLGTPDRWFRWGIIALIVTVVFIVAGLNYGPLGVAGAYSASYYVLIGPALHFAGKPINLKFYDILLEVWKYFISALVSGIFSWFILYRCAWTSYIFSDLNIFIRIITCFIFYILIYLLLVISLYRGVKPISRFLYVLREMILGTPLDN